MASGYRVNIGYDLSIVIPAYNESERLPHTLLDIQKFIGEEKLRCEVLVVDDGSRDDMCAKVKLIQETFPELHLITYSPNRGKGYATKTGVLAATGKYVVFLDADNSTNIREFLRAQEYLTDYDIVIGSRYLPDSDIVIAKKLHRTLISRFSNILIRKILPLPFKDTQCGFKVFKLQYVRNIFSKQTIDRFGFDMELLVIAMNMGLKIKEVGVKWIDNPQTKVRPVRDTFRTFRELITIRRNLDRGIYS